MSTVFRDFVYLHKYLIESEGVFMTNAQILKGRIKSQCENQGKSITAMLSELSLGVNAINQINEKKGMGSFVLANIADYLGCSVDYLLGRTDEPKTETSDPTTQILVERFSSLSPEDKIAVLNMVLERSKK